MQFSDYLIENLKREIEELEVELNYQHNNELISPNKKIILVKKVLSKILNKKQILELYINYILESKNKENGITTE